MRRIPYRHSVLSLLLLFLVHCALLASASDPGADIPGVVELVGESFDQVVNPDSSKYVFVEFYATWCAQCKNFVKEFTNLGEAYVKASDEVKEKLVLAKIDAVKHEEIAARYHVNSFPAIFLFSPGADEPTRYRAHREAYLMSDFLQTTIQGLPALISEPHAISLAYTTTLTAKNFNEIVMNPDKDVLVFFFAPWCGHCNNFKPSFSKLGEIYDSDKDNLVIARFDASKKSSEEIANRYQVRSFPTLYFFPRGREKAPVLFSGKRTVADLVHFINGLIDRPRLLSGDVSWKYGVVAELSEMINKYVLAASTEEQNELEKAIQKSIDVRLSRKERGAATYQKVFKMLQGSSEPLHLLHQKVSELGFKALEYPRGVERDAMHVELNIVRSIVEMQE